MDGARLTVPYLFFAALLVVAVIVVALAPETVTRPEDAPRLPAAAHRRPAAARARSSPPRGAFVSFAAFGLFTSLAPSFLAGTLGHTSHVLAGVRR